MNRVVGLFTEIDLFYEPIQFKFDKGKTEYKTFMGAIATICFLSIMFGYTLERVTKMVKYVDANVVSNSLLDHFNPNDTYVGSTETFAFGISGWQEKSEDYRDYGSIRFFYERWNLTSDVLFDVEHRPCIYADFGLE